MASRPNVHPALWDLMKCITCHTVSSYALVDTDVFVSLGQRNIVYLDEDDDFSEIVKPGTPITGVLVEVLRETDEAEKENIDIKIDELLIDELLMTHGGRKT